MAGNTIEQIFRISELTELANVSNSKTIIAYNKNNYFINTDLIKGKKISRMIINESQKNGEANSLTLVFSDGTTEVLYAFNGTEGNRGKTGETGDKGNTGADGVVDTNKIGVTGILQIINEYKTNEIESDKEKAWSAYRGKRAYNDLVNLNEIFITDDQYQVLFDPKRISYIVATFTTSEDNEEVTLFTNDTNPHTVYNKYWTYEESDVATYYVVTKWTTDSEGNIIPERYDAVVANLWTDIYEGETKGYFLSTNNQFKDGDNIYFYDEKENTYVKLNPTENGDLDFQYYSTNMEEYINVHYDGLMNIYDYSLDCVSELPKPIYKHSTPKSYKKDEDGNETDIVDEWNFEEVTDLTSLDRTGVTEYFSAENENSKITNLDEYLGTTPDRFFVKNSEGKYIEVKESSIDKENLQEYIEVVVDKVANEYAFTRTYKVRQGREFVYASVTEVYKNGTINIYSYFDNREYYTSKLVEKTDDEGNIIYENEYTKITRPYLIFAQFTTFEEDENILLLNSVYEWPGEEDNSVIDTSAEDYSDNDEEFIDGEKVFVGDLPILYRKDGNEYILVDEDDDIDLSKETFYIYDNKTEIEYKPISLEDIIDLEPGTVIYTKDENDEYVLYNAIEDGAPTDENEYFIQDIVETYYQPFDDTKSEKVIFTGIPEQLPIKFYPLNSNNNIAVLNYDSNIITIYDDGRIAAIDNDNSHFDENNEIHTSIDYVLPNGFAHTLNIVVLTPMRSMTMIYQDSEENAEINRGKTSAKINVTDSTKNYENTKAIIECVASPITTSNPRVEFTTKDNVLFGNTTFNQEINTTTLEVYSDTIGKDMVIKSTSIDGFAKQFGVEKSLSLEVIQPVDSVKWHDIHFAEGDTEKSHLGTIGYTEDEIYNHNMENPDDTWDYETIKDYSATLLKDVEYELVLDILPENASYPQMIWRSYVDGELDSSFARVESRKITFIDQEEISHEATSEDIDNGYEGNIGDIIIDTPEISHQITKYILTCPKLTDEINELRLVGTNEDAITKEVSHTIEIVLEVIKSVETVTISPSSLSINNGTTKKLVATLEPEGADLSFVWESKDPNILSINENGVITAKAPGITEIYAKALDGSGKVGKCNVTVTIPMIDINIISNENIDNGIIYVGIGKTSTISADTFYAGTSNIDNIESYMFGVDWASSNNSVVSVQDNGNKTANITGNNLGNATIIAYAKDGSGTLGTIQVKVIQMIENIDFDESVKNITISLNDSLALTPIFNPEDSTNQVVRYESSDETIAIVDEWSGIVTAINEGEVDITAYATDGSLATATSHITIIKNL